MKIAILILTSFLIMNLNAQEGAAIPSELVGEWRTSDGNGILYLRADGLSVVIGGPPPIGFLCLASYHSKSYDLILSPRIPSGDLPAGAKQPPDIKLSYDPKTMTITSTGDMGPYKRYSEVLIEPYKSIDLKKAFN